MKPITIETQRLKLLPLSLSQLQKYLQNNGLLETELGVNQAQRTITDELTEALEKTILPAVADTERNHLFSTLWTIVYKQDNCLAGDLCFYGEPDAEGSVEIGYGTYEAYRNQGIMTEAVAAMIEWAASFPGVSTIKASTDADNPASWSVLLKNGFSKNGESESIIFWKRTLLRQPLQK